MAALPGAPGSKVDWLDVLLSDGADVVRNAMLNAPAFEPMVDEIESNKQRVNTQHEIAKVSEIYPLPGADDAGLDYQAKLCGEVFWHRYSDQHKRSLPIASPFGVANRLKFPDRDEAFGLRVVYRAWTGNRG